MADPDFLTAHRVHYCSRTVRANNVDALNIAIRDVRNSALKEKAIKSGRGRLQHLFETAGFDVVVVSNESALGDPFNDHLPGFFPMLDAALAGVCTMFEGYRVVPVFFLRDQATLLPSFYGQRIRQGASYSLEEFEARVCMYDLSWRPVVKSIAAAFPTANLELHQFEEFAHDSSAYTAALFGRLLELQRMPAREPVSKNRAAKSLAMGLMRRANWLVECLPLVPRSKKYKLKKRLRRSLFPLFEHVKSGLRLELGPAAAATLRAQYQKDLVALKIKGPAQENRP